MALGHKRIRPRGEFVREGRPVAIRIAIHCYFGIAVPIEFHARLVVAFIMGDYLQRVARHGERNAIERPAPGIGLADAIDRPIRKTIRRRHARLVRRNRRPRPHVLAHRLKKRPFRLAANRIGRVAMRIVKPKFAVGIGHRSLLATLRHERIRSCGKFLGEGRSVAVRIARAVAIEIAVPVPFVAIGNAIAIAVERRGQVVGGEHRLFIELERRRVERTPQIVARIEFLRRRNRPARKDVAAHRGRRLSRVGAPRLQRRIADLIGHPARRRLFVDMHHLRPRGDHAD